MADFSVPHGVMVTPPQQLKPSARVASEYADYDRDYLLYRIEELEESESALSDELTAALMQVQRCEKAAQAVVEIARYDTRNIILTQAELDERIAEATKPKRRTRK